MDLLILENFFLLNGLSSIYDMIWYKIWYILRIMKGLCSGIASSVDFVIYIYMYIIRNGFRERITQSLLVYLNKTEAKKNMNDLVYSQVRSKPQSRKPIT